MEPTLSRHLRERPATGDRTDSPTSADYDEIELDNTSISHARGLISLSQDQGVALEGAAATQVPLVATTARSNSARRPPATGGHPASAAGSASHGSSHSSVFAPVVPTDRDSQPAPAAEASHSVSRSVVFPPAVKDTAPSSAEGNPPLGNDAMEFADVVPHGKLDTVMRLQQAQLDAAEKQGGAGGGGFRGGGPENMGGLHDGGGKQYSTLVSPHIQDEPNDTCNPTDGNSSASFPTDATTALQDDIVKNFVVKPVVPAVTREAWLKLQHANSTQFSACNGAVVIDSDEVSTTTVLSSLARRMSLH